MFAFALADGRAKGFEAGIKHRRVSGNPFHKSYPHGAPAMYFRTGYRLGKEAAKEALKNISKAPASNLELELALAE